MPTTRSRVQVTIDDELADALAAVDASPASRSRLIRDLAIRGADAIRADRLQTREAVSHLIAIADGDQPHDFAAVQSVLAGRGDRLP
jgi:metal-responsive CopG/Arc/MetJ family transcriptional regulator